MDVAGHQEETRDERILSAMPLVRRIAGHLFNLRQFDGVPFEEYLQLGAEGLVRAVDAYDPSQGASFETYAGYRIKGSILSGLEKATEVNQQVTTLKRIAKERLESLTDNATSDDEETDETKRAFGRLLEVSIGMAVAFMLEDTSLFQIGEETPHWDDGPANLSFKQLQRRLLNALTQLNDNEQKVIEQHYFEHGNFERIAIGMGLSKGRISQIHRQALTRLRSLLRVGTSFDLLG